MKLKKEVISLVIAVLVVGGMIGALAWQRNRDTAGPEEEFERPATIHLTQRLEEELLRVTFQNHVDSHVMLPFYDDEGNREWTLDGSDYIFNPANTRNKVRGMFSLFANQIVHEDVYEIGIDLAEFGLDPPYLTVTGYYDDGTTAVIRLGYPTMGLEGRFVMMDGSYRLYAINAPLANRFLYGLDDLIDRRLPMWSLEFVQYMLIAQRDEEPIEFKMEPHPEAEGMEWMVMHQPFPDRQVFDHSFDHLVFEQFANFRLGDLVSLHPANLADYGLDNPSMEFVYITSQEEVHLLFGDIFFREEDGREETFIYVMFADRPHVFEAVYGPASAIFDVNPLRFIERFIALINIVDVERLEVITPDGDFDIRMNHVEGTTNIEPTVNGNTVEATPIRQLYAALVGLGMDFEIEPFNPGPGTLLYTIRYVMLEEDDVELRFFHYNNNFLAVSVDGEAAWFVTNRRAFDSFISRINELI